MISSFTSKFRNFLFNEQQTVVNQESSRKRKRCDFDREEEDDDIIITAVKRPKIEHQSLFSRVISSPYNKMAEWVKSKSKWTDIHFFKKYNKSHEQWEKTSHLRQYERIPRNGRFVNFDRRNINGPKTIQESSQVKQKNVFRSVPTQTENVLLVNGVNGINGDTESNASGASQGHREQPKRLFTLKECVRLDEKEQYRQLLQQFATVPVASSTEVQNSTLIRSPSTSVQWPSEIVLAGNVKHDVSGTFQHNHRHRPPDSKHHQITPSVYGAHVQKQFISPIEVIKSARVCREKLTSHVVKPQQKKEQSHKSKTADELEKTTESRKDSFSTFRDSPYLASDWMDEMVSKYSVESRERNRKIAEEEIKAKVYDERRIAREENLEKEIRHRMRILSAAPAVAEEPQIEDIEEEKDVLPELTEEMEEEISRALRPGNPDQILSEGFRLQITKKDMTTLSGLNWLNDEIINFYMSLLMERGEQEGNSKVYAFNTFFYPKIISGGHTAVRRWTRRVDVFAMDYIVIPVHLGMHWCLCVVDFKKKLVQYFDSMGGKNIQCLNAIRNYLCEESLDKKKKEFDLTGWSTVIAEDIPQQMNGSDCGMFACKYAEYITRGADITFTQQNMPYFRKRMVYEILKKKLLQ